MQSHAKPSLIHDRICRQHHCSECTPTNADTCSAFDKGQLVLEHAKLLIRAKTCTSITGSWIVEKHANTRPALDTGQHMQIHDRISRSAETCTFMLSSWYWLTYDDTNKHMQVHAKRLTHAETCVHTLSSWYWPTYKDTRSAPDKCRKMPDSKHAQHMQTHSQLSICSNVCSPQCVQIHAKTCPALKIANARRYTLGSWYVQTHAHTSSTLDAGKQIKTHAQPSICADTFTHARLLMQANK